MLRLFIGNLPHDSSAQDVQKWIESRGFRVETAEIIYDRVTGRSRGFGFVTLADNPDHQTATSALNGKQMDGRPLTVNHATPRPTRSAMGSGDRPAPSQHHN
jgi:nucleolin